MIPETTRSGRVNSIQYLRAVAALLVFAFHSAFRGGAEQTFFVGNIGVDTFFVISGFVMWTITERRPPKVGVFLARRLARIVPLYWAVTLTYVLIGVVAPSLSQHSGGRLEAREIVYSLLFIPYYSQSGQIDPVVPPGWTLNMEMFFYVVFALALCVPARLRLAFLSVFMVVAALVGYLGGPHKWAPLELFTRPLILEFLAGVFLGWWWSRGRLPGAVFGYATLATGVALLVAYQVFHIEPGKARFIMWGGVGVLLVLGALCVEKAGKLPKLPVLGALGDASYSIYLLHTMVLAVAFKLVGERPVQLFLVALVPLTLTAWLVYRFWEKPSYARLTGWTGQRLSGARA